jgi:hypothetical protein
MEVGGLAHSRSLIGRLWWLLGTCWHKEIRRLAAKSPSMVNDIHEFWFILGFPKM